MNRRRIGGLVLLTVLLSGCQETVVSVNSPNIEVRIVLSGPAEVAPNPAVLPWGAHPITPIADDPADR